MTTPVLHRRFVDGAMFGTADFGGPDDCYRYNLTRTWDPTLPAVAFVLLNPSKADERRVDPTLARCIGFARAWGYGGLIVRNPFAFRATQPAELAQCLDPVGPDNDAWLRQLLDDAPRVIVGWGVGGKLYGRQAEVRQILRPHPDVRCLGTTRDGSPRHPLYLPKTAHPMRYGWTR